jgi:hypothetical protein
MTECNSEHDVLAVTHQERLSHWSTYLVNLAFSGERRWPAQPEFFFRDASSFPMTDESADFPAAEMNPSRWNVVACDCTIVVCIVRHSVVKPHVSALG